MTMEEYLKRGGESIWIVYAAFILGIPARQIRITAVKEGSVIVDFLIGSPSSGSYEAQQKKLAEIKAKLDTAVKTGTLNPYKDENPEIIILNYESGIITPDALESCPNGQYVDNISNVCADCPKSCPNCATDPCDEDDGGANLGAILGGVLGGLALIMVLVVLVVLYKKGTFTSSKKSQSPSSAKYDLAHSQPTSPDTNKTVQA